MVFGLSAGSLLIGAGAFAGGVALAVVAAVGVVETQRSAASEPLDTTQPVNYGSNG